jgi:hypothetical protein
MSKHDWIFTPILKQQSRWKREMAADKYDINTTIVTDEKNVQ